ncbi:MAG: ImmA/IrrE family metallo-endopeptidase [Solirubrobacterales bacterium]
MSGAAREAGGGLDREWIEARADAVLRALPEGVWDGRSLPVPIEAIVAEHFGLHVREVTDLTAAPGCPPLGEGQALSALLLPSEREIWVSAAEARAWPRRRRFSIAHEVGHWLLHRDGQQSLFCRRASIDEGADPGRADADARPELPLIEREAHAFASALLMPGDLLRHHYKAVDRDFHRLCEIFDSSMSAMGRRLHAAVPRSR